MRRRKKAALTRPFENTVAVRAARDPSFKEALFKETVRERIKSDDCFLRWLAREMHEAMIARIGRKKKK